MNRLKELRNEFGFTIRDFEEYHLGRNVITYIENGKTDVNFEKLSIFCKIFQVSADYFSGLCDEGIYVNYQDTIYSLNRDNFLKYKQLGFINYESNKRILVLPNNYEISFLLPTIKLIEIIKKD